MQFDVDEIWNPETLTELLTYTQNNSGFDGMLFKCNYYVGPDLVIENENCYGDYSYEWCRLWKIKNKTNWLTHEPPRIKGCTNFITKNYTKQKRWIFNHYAYVYEKQVEFKEKFYNYENAVNNWKLLQNQNNFPCKLKNFLPWVDDQTIVNKIKNMNKQIDSEDPNVHWQYLTCKDERVIDFGCAYNDTDSENTRVNKLGTPQFIIKQTPQIYVGIDIYQPDIDTFVDEFKKNSNVRFLNKKIESPTDIQVLFDEYLPTVIKSDIEGAEIHLCNTIPPEQLKQIAIETHSFEIENAILNWAKKYNFNTTHTQILTKHPHIKIYYFSR